MKRGGRHLLVLAPPHSGGCRQGTYKFFNSKTPCHAELRDGSSGSIFQVVRVGRTTLRYRQSQISRAAWTPFPGSRDARSKSSTAFEVPPPTECRPAPPKPQATPKPVPSHLLWCYSGVAPMLMPSTWEQHRCRWLVYGLVQAWGWLGSGSHAGGLEPPLPDTIWR